MMATRQGSMTDAVFRVLSNDWQTREEIAMKVSALLDGEPVRVASVAAAIRRLRAQSGRGVACRRVPVGVIDGIFESAWEYRWDE